VTGRSQFRIFCRRARCSMRGVLEVATLRIEAALPA
jgi:hypothetical protein